MNITRGTYNGAVPMPEINVAVDLVDDGIEITNVYRIAVQESYQGRRWTFDGVNYGVISTYRFDCSDLKDNTQWSDLASWHVYSNKDGFIYAENLFAMTFASKAASGLYANATERLPIAAIFVPWANSEIGDTSVFLQLPESSVVIPGQGITVNTTSQNAAQWRQSLMPTAAITGPSSLGPNATGSYSVAITRNGSVDASCNTELNVETTGGYLPLQRVPIVNGEATFRLQTTGLLAGEKLKLKVGFRNYSSLASKAVSIS